MKSILLVLVTMMLGFAGSSNAASITLNCHSDSVQANGVLEIDSQNNATGTLALSVTTATGTEVSTSVFSGTYSVYPAGSFCYDSTVTSLLVSTQTPSGTSVAIKSIRGVDCSNQVVNGDTIYVSKDTSVATCTLSK